MDAVTDLASRAVSFIVLIQDAFLQGPVLSHDRKVYTISDIFCDDFSSKFQTHINEFRSDARYKTFEEKTVELVWISIREPLKDTTISYTIQLCEALVEWVIMHRKSIGLDELAKSTSFPPPQSWRQAIGNMLYACKEQRVELAKRLQYLPKQVILAMGAGLYSTREQRQFQVWQMTEVDLQYFFSAAEKEVYIKFFDEAHSQYSSHIEKNCLEQPGTLIETLLQQNVSLPFELIFKDELDEVHKSRIKRFNENSMASVSGNCSAGTLHDYSNMDNVVERAHSMELCALAFSGGGIRSATFNLGILQGLAKAGIIPKVDYLSTVSGGGYIGSWLATWIKRDGSVSKVCDRLDPAKSSDPFAEEVRPIRWLRMYGNYLNPQSNIMSTDSWTVGVTWLRNTLLNQLILLLLFMTVFLAGRVLQGVWNDFLYWDGNSTVRVYLWSSVLLIPVCLLLGFGMQTYKTERFPPNALKRETTNMLKYLVPLAGLLGSFLVSGWLHSKMALGEEHEFLEMLAILYPAMIVAAICLMIIAILGRYDTCIKGPRSPISWLLLAYTAAIASGLGGVCLCLVWLLFQHIAANGENGKVIFTIGVPLVLEVFGLTVVARMALLGRYFPDERREWWGRMGAEINRIALFWLLIAGAALLAYDYLKSLLPELLPALGGWTVIVGAAVKAAISPKSSANKETTGFTATWLNLLSLVGPYLFILGILIFVPVLLGVIVGSVIDLSFWDSLGVTKGWRIPAITVFLGLITYRLSDRVGVNEFSMHHFYKNRLVRAYLGATRRRLNRQQTANTYTDFDMRDDAKLSLFTNENGYYGPYPVINTALNASENTSLDRQDRKAESFIFSPLYCGFDFSMTRASADPQKKSYDYAYRPTKVFAYPDDRGPGIGTAMAISGAAANPNWGYHSNAGTAFLLTVFNVQLGWWIGNPRKNYWKQSDPDFGLAYIIANLAGKTSTRNRFVCLSDGGHFDNMGLYEMVRRRCSFIILGDGEQDDNFTCEGLANAIRRCRIDFGAEIELDLTPIVTRTPDRLSVKQYAWGKIWYPGHQQPGTILYLKSSITGREPVDVREYSLKNKAFPHQSTGDQFFDEQQFESYRKLGVHVVAEAFKEPGTDKGLPSCFEKLPGKKGGLWNKVKRYLKWFGFGSYTQWASRLV